jgi:hypothetical protein
MPVKWGTVGSWTAVTITLNSVTTDTSAIGTTVIANGTNLELYMDVSLRLGSINPTGAPYVELHRQALLDDGTTYEDVALSGATMIAAAPVTTGSSAKNVSFMPPRYPLLIPPGSFRLAVVNRTGQTFAGSGNSLNYRLYSLS